MKTIRTLVASIIVLCIAFGAGVFTGIKFLSSGKIKIVKQTEYKTEYKYINLKNPEYNQENFDALKACLNSPLNMKAEPYKDNVIRVTAEDACKSNRLDVELSSHGNWKLYLGFGTVGTLLGGAIVYKLIK
jgi:hypothetical protein